MGQDEVIDFFYSFLPEKKRDDSFPDIKGILWRASPIDQHFFMARELDKYRISLSHIDKGQL